MIIKGYFGYRTFVWVLLGVAIFMGAVFLAIAYTYNLQKKTEVYIESARYTVSEAKEMENELTAIKGLTYTYLVNKSDTWLDSLQKHQQKFIVYLERARLRANSQEEVMLIRQISALFSNHEQNILTAVEKYKSNDLTKANALLLYSAKDLLATIQFKNNELINTNLQDEKKYEKELSRTNSIILNKIGRASWRERV